MAIASTMDRVLSKFPLEHVNEVLRGDCTIIRVCLIHSCQLTQFCGYVMLLKHMPQKV